MNNKDTDLFGWCVWINEFWFKIELNFGNIMEVVVRLFNKPLNKYKQWTLDCKHIKND